MKHTALRTVLIVALFSVTSVLQADVVNLVKNGQFTEYTGTPSSVGNLPAGNGDSITNWKVVGSNSYGVVTKNTTTAFIDSISPYIDTLGNHLFVQTGTGVRSVSQNITGLEVGKSYVVNFLYGSRVRSGGTATLSCTLGGEELLNSNSATANQHYSVFKTFTATNESADFIFTSNTTGGDYTFNLQNVVIKEATETNWKSFSACTDASSIIEGDKYTHAVHFRASGGGNFVTNGVTFNTINGAGAIANSYISHSAGTAVNNTITNTDFQAMGTGFYAFTANGTDEVPQYITLDGLLPGFEYETTIYSNQYGVNSRQATVSVNGEDSIMVCANSFDGANGTNQMSALVWQGNANSDGVISFNFTDMGSNTNGIAYPHFHGVANRFISAPEGTLLAAAFSGTNDQFNGTTAIGTKVDTINLVSPESTWQVRGLDNGNNKVIYNSTFATKSSLSLGFNTGAAVEFNSPYLTENEITHLQISVDIAVGTTTTDNLMQYARGAGVGFYSETFGTGMQAVGRGFSGIVVTPEGGLYYYNNMTNGDTDYIATEPIAYQGGTFSPNDFNTLFLDLVLNDDGTATLLDILFGDSTANYAALLDGSVVFQTMDLFGMIASSSTDKKNAYFDNLIITGRSEIDPPSGQVPEPSTWALIIIGSLALLGIRRKK